MPDTPAFKPYETNSECPVCFDKPKLQCHMESVFAGSTKTRHLICPKCSYRTEDVVNGQGQVILKK